LTGRPLPERCHIKHVEYIAQHGQDLVEIHNWKWGLAKAGKPL
jgi:phosphoketolase